MRSRGQSLSIAPSRTLTTRIPEKHTSCHLLLRMSISLCSGIKALSAQVRLAATPIFSVRTFISFARSTKILQLTFYHNFTNYVLPNGWKSRLFNNNFNNVYGHDILHMFKLITIWNILSLLVVVSQYVPSITTSTVTLSSSLQVSGRFQAARQSPHTGEGRLWESSSSSFSREYSL